MDAIDQVLWRLRRIEALDRGQGGSPALLDELRQLVGEAEAWARAEGDRRAREAVAGLRDGVERQSRTAASLARSPGERPIPGRGEET